MTSAAASTAAASTAASAAGEATSAGASDPHGTERRPGEPTPGPAPQAAVVGAPLLRHRAPGTSGRRSPVPPPRHPGPGAGPTPHPARLSGPAEVAAARADGRWAAGYESQRHAAVPDDLAAALARRPRARAAFEAFGRAGRYRVTLGLFRAPHPHPAAREARSSGRRASWRRCSRGRYRAHGPRTCRAPVFRGGREGGRARDDADAARAEARVPGVRLSRRSGRPRCRSSA
ncbi:YdeI/OmpD-associated family protein [Streptomyces sp. bgisy153]|uniref:YdeI/OmpD-associated family protein n=1 Tax=Streptomyces sp. bgisy153 TaxID=3413793 RepID=UPI003D704218